jgi:ribonuclease HII
MAKSGEPSSTSSGVSPAKRRESASAAPPDLRVESLLWEHGARLIAGVDEAGRGAWAGPVVAASVILPCDEDLLRALLSRMDPPGDEASDFCGVRDSKQLTAAQRAAADLVVRRHALHVGIGVVPPSVVDDVGLSFAGQLAFWRAVQDLRVDPEHLLVDGFPLWCSRYPQTAVIHGDARCLSIAAASVVAKVARDNMMSELHRSLPGYGFATNRGYGTRSHADALRTLGPSMYHRRSYSPVSSTFPSEDDA